MARIITTIGGSSSAGLTSADVLALIRANEGYEFVKFVPLNGTVSTLDITSLDTTTYTAFRFVCSNLSLAGSGGQTVYFQIGYGNTVTTSGYYNSWISMPTTSTINYAGNASSVNAWTANYFGEGGASYTWNPTVDLQFPTISSNMDAICWITVNSLQAYYNGSIAGAHLPSGSNPNMFRFAPSNSITGSTTYNSGVYVLGIRKRTS